MMTSISDEAEKAVLGLHTHYIFWTNKFSVPNTDLYLHITEYAIQAKQPQRCD